VILECVYTGRETKIQADGIVMITARVPNDELYFEVTAQTDKLAKSSIKSLSRIGDCLAPGTIAASVHSGHKFAQEFDEPKPADVPFKREENVLGL
jgi:dimethylamine/trimethylamine dehydrogenase